MQHPRDTILEGVRAADLEQIRLLANGVADQRRTADLTRLEANGWIEIAHGTPLITITGRTLLETAAC